MNLASAHAHYFHPHDRRTVLQRRWWLAQTYDIPFPLSEGTLHHVFEGGWLWVIPFNNHPRSSNPLISIGIQVDPRIYPTRKDLTPEEEFYALIDQFPDMKAQFRNAKPVRGWTRTERLQYSSKRIVGDRFCLVGHAAGFIDPLYSKGMYTTFSSVSLLADLLVDGTQNRRLFDRALSAARRYDPFVRAYQRPSGCQLDQIVGQL